MFERPAVLTQVLVLALLLIFGGATTAAAIPLAPSVSSVAVPADGTYGSGQVLNFDVAFSQNVTVTGTPRMTLTIGSTTVYATYASGSGTGVLRFSYTVVLGQHDADGISVGPLTLNGGTIRDSGAIDADLNLNSVAPTANVRVDAVDLAAPVPTLSEWAMILMGVGLAGAATVVIGRRRRLEA